MASPVPSAPRGLCSVCEKAPGNAGGLSCGHVFCHDCFGSFVSGSLNELDRYDTVNQIFSHVIYIRITIQIVLVFIEKNYSIVSTRQLLFVWCSLSDDRQTIVTCLSDVPPDICQQFHRNR